MGASVSCTAVSAAHPVYQGLHWLDGPGPLHDPRSSSLLCHSHLAAILETKGEGGASFNLDASRIVQILFSFLKLFWDSFVRDWKSPGFHHSCDWSGYCSHRGNMQLSFLLVFNIINTIYYFPAAQVVFVHWKKTGVVFALSLRLHKRNHRWRPAVHFWWRRLSCGLAWLCSSASSLGTEMPRSFLGIHTVRAGAGRVGVVA